MQRRERRQVCECCAIVRDALAPTMDHAPADGAVVLMTRGVMERAYAAAISGARGGRARGVRFARRGRVK